MPDDVAIRAAAPADAAAIAHLHRETWRTTYTGILPADVIERQAGKRSEELWRNRLTAQRAPATTWIAEIEGEAAGFVSCGPARHLLGGLEAEIYALYVLRPRQRLGAGRELVRACARHFVRHGLFGFYLWVLKANRARLFYEALGGQEVGEKSERLGQHSFAEVAYAWHDLTALIDAPQSASRHCG